MKSSDAPQKIRPYIFHGCELTIDSVETVGDCPFCDKPGHFRVETKSGKFRCVRCEEKGNVYSFLKQIHHYSLQKTGNGDYQELAEQRGLEPYAIRDWGLARSFITGEWLIPGYNRKGRLGNLSRVVTSHDGKTIIMSTPTCKQHPFGTKLITSGHDIIDVCEGPWDGMAWYHVLNSYRSKQGNSIVRTMDPSKSLFVTRGVIAVPGSGNFNPDWFTYVKDRSVNLLFDNDHPKKTASGKTVKPAWDGMGRIADLARERAGDVPSELYCLKWGAKGYNKSFANGYDIRDLINDKRPAKAFRFVQSHLDLVDITPRDGGEDDDRRKLEPLPRETFDELCQDFREELHFTQQIKDTLAIVMAVCVGTDLLGEQLWLRLIGPPGSGKSTLAEALSASWKYTFPVSLQTGFHSGWIGSGGRNKGKDSSLIPRMKNKTVIIKDGDTLLNNPSRDRILSELRDLYDGSTRAIYRNRKESKFDNLRITFLLCGTDDLRKLNRSSLGERFLDCEIIGDEKIDQYLKVAGRNTYNLVMRSIRSGANYDNLDENTSTTRIKRATMGLIENFKELIYQKRLPDISLSDDADFRLESMGHFLAYMRARVEREKEDLVARPRVELPTRLKSQFVKLAICLAVVLGKSDVDREVLRLVRKVMCDTAYGFQFEVTRLLYKHRKTGLSAHQLELKMNIGKSKVNYLLRDMMELNIVERDRRPNNSGQRGRNRHVYHLTDELRNLYRNAMRKGGK